MSTRVYADGILREQWDDTTRTYTAYSAQGTQTSTRPYTAEENAAADAEASQQAEDTNRQTIETALSAALTELQTLLDTSNATINSNPAGHIKTVARAERRIIRLLIRRFDGTT